MSSRRRSDDPTDRDLAADEGEPAAPEDPQRAVDGHDVGEPGPRERRERGPFGRHDEVDGACVDHVYGLASKTPRNLHLVNAKLQLLRTHERDIGRATDDNGTRHLFIPFLVFLPMPIAAGATDASRHSDHQPI